MGFSRSILVNMLLLGVCVFAQEAYIPEKTPRRPGLSESDVDYLVDNNKTWYDASVYCDARRGYESSSISMLRQHFAESASHFISVSVEESTQKKGTDLTITKAICIKDRISPKPVGENRTINFMIGKIGSSWSTDELEETTGLNDAVAKASSRMEAAAGTFFKSDKAKYKFKMSRYHYDFVCTTTDNQRCPPVDQVFCTEDRLNACYIRQQPIRLNNNVSYFTGRLEFPILSMSYNYANRRRVTYDPSAQFTVNTLPGINDARSLTFFPTSNSYTNTDASEKLKVSRLGLWRAIPEEVFLNNICKGAKGSLTPDQSINGGFPLIVEAVSPEYCILGQNSFQVQAYRSSISNTTNIFGIGRTAYTGTCENAQNVVIRGLPAWTSTLRFFNTLSLELTSFVKKREICAEYLNYISPEFEDKYSNTTICKMPYCAPLYVPNNDSQLVQITPLIGESSFNYTPYGGDDWPRSQYDVGTKGANAYDGVLCETSTAGVALAFECIEECSKYGFILGYYHDNIRCSISTDVSDRCSDFSANYTFSITSNGFQFNGDLKQTGSNTELSPAIVLGLKNTPQNSTNTPNYIGQNTLKYSTMGQGYNDVGCVNYLGTFASFLESSLPPREEGVVEAVLNSTVALNPAEDVALESLVSRAVDEVSITGNELTAVDVTLVIAASISSLTSVAALVFKDTVQKFFVSAEGVAAVASLLAIGGALILMCFIGLLPVALAIRQEVNAINAVSSQQNIESSTSDLGVFDTRYENVYMTIVEVENSPRHGTLYVAVLYVTCIVWLALFITLIVVFALTIKRKKKMKNTVIIQVSP